MTEFPVDVLKSDEGEYIAKLADLPDGPQGSGVDPYAALEDLNKEAQTVLSVLEKQGDLPAPSPASDRPTISFEGNGDIEAEARNDTRKLTGQAGKLEGMLCYSWTNSITYRDD